MPRKKVPLFDGMEADKETTKGPQKDGKASTDSLRNAYNTPMHEYRVRLPSAWWEALRQRGAVRGLKPSQVIRELVAAYLRGSD